MPPERRKASGRGDRSGERGGGQLGGPPASASHGGGHPLAPGHDRPAATVSRLESPALAGGQAAWIAAIEPWLGLGYRAEVLRGFLRRSAAAGQVWMACGPGAPRPLGVLVVQPGVLLGNFVALLAVRPDAARQGIGRALIAFVESHTFSERRWLFVSADATNRVALRFYRQLGFSRVARLPDLVREGRTEILLRKGRADRPAGRRIGGGASRARGRSREPGKPAIVAR